MKKRRLTADTNDELLRRLEIVGIAQYDALNNGKLKQFNSLYEDRKAIEKELELRVGDRRSLLVRFFEHSNLQVRLNAAMATLTVAPELARQQLRDIKASGHFPQAGDAGMSLVMLESGTFTPT